MNFRRNFEMFNGQYFEDRLCEENVESISSKALDFCSGHTGSNLDGYTVL